MAYGRYRRRRRRNRRRRFSRRARPSYARGTQSTSGGGGTVGKNLKRAFNFVSTSPAVRSFATGAINYLAARAVKRMRGPNGPIMIGGPTNTEIKCITKSSLAYTTTANYMAKADGTLAAPDYISNLIVPQGLGYEQRIGRQFKVLKDSWRFQIFLSPPTSPVDTWVQQPMLVRAVAIYRGRFQTIGSGSPNVGNLFLAPGDPLSYYNANEGGYKILFDQVFRLMPTGTDSTSSFIDRGGVPYQKNLNFTYKKPYLVRWKTTNTDGDPAEKEMGKITWYFGAFGVANKNVGSTDSILKIHMDRRTYYVDD